MSDLTRFHEAQEDSYDAALAELKAGRKSGHWIWYVFPQLASLGQSPASKFYGIADRAEAKAYASDPKLASRLVECAEALEAQDATAEAILGPTDAMKLRSSATLFREVGDDYLAGHMQALLTKFFGGKPDPRILAEIGDKG